MENSYDKLPLEFLAGFYYYINLNIKKGILSEAMYHEIDLIKQVAIKRGIPLDYLHKKGCKAYIATATTGHSQRKE